MEIWNRPSTHAQTPSCTEASGLIPAATLPPLLPPHSLTHPPCSPILCQIHHTHATSCCKCHHSSRVVIPDLPGHNNVLLTCYSRNAVVEALPWQFCMSLAVNICTAQVQTSSGGTNFHEGRLCANLSLCDLLQLAGHTCCARKQRLDMW